MPHPASRVPLPDLQIAELVGLNSGFHHEDVDPRDLSSCWVEEPERIREGANAALSLPLSRSERLSGLEYL